MIECSINIHSNQSFLVLSRIILQMFCMVSIQRYLHMAKLGLGRPSPCLDLTGMTIWEAIKIRWVVWRAVSNHKEVTHFSANLKNTASSLVQLSTFSKE